MKRTQWLMHMLLRSQKPGSAMEQEHFASCEKVMNCINIGFKA